MRKRLLAFIAALALACAFAPGVALANVESDGVVSVTIEIGPDGAPVGTSGEGWTYDSATKTLTLDAGHSFRLTGNAYAGKAINNGSIENGTFHEFVHNYQTIVGGEFDGYVANYEGAVISGGTFNDGGCNNSLDNSGTISGGEFAINAHNEGVIGGDSTFHAYVENRPTGTIEGGMFHDEVYNTGAIANGTFDGLVTVTEGGVIAGGTFALTSTVESNDDGAISGGTFTGSVTNGDPDWPGAVITGGTFTGTVTNHDTITGGAFSAPVTNYGTISSGSFAAPVANKAGGAVEGGQFDGGIVNDGGSVAACQYPLIVKLTGLSLAATGQEPSENLLVTYQKDSGESNLFTLSANKGYTLPSTIELHLESANGTPLAAGTDYIYNAKTGALAIKKSSAAGPLHLTATGTLVPGPKPDTNPDLDPDSKLDPDTKPKPSPEDPAAKVTPLPSAPACEPSASSTSTLASTGDNALALIVLGAALVSGCVLAAWAIARRRARANR